MPLVKDTTERQIDSILDKSEVKEFELITDDLKIIVLGKLLGSFKDNLNTEYYIYKIDDSENWILYVNSNSTGTNNPNRFYIKCNSIDQIKTKIKDLISSSLNNLSIIELLNINS